MYAAAGAPVVVLLRDRAGGDDYATAIKARTVFVPVLAVEPTAAAALDEVCGINVRAVYMLLSLK